MTTTDSQNFKEIQEIDVSSCGVTLEVDLPANFHQSPGRKFMVNSTHALFAYKAFKWAREYTNKVEILHDSKLNIRADWQDLSSDLLRPEVAKVNLTQAGF